MATENQLKLYRAKSGLKQEDAAKTLRITIRQYQRMESKTPKSITQFHQLAKLYNATVDALLEQVVNGGETK